MYISSSLSKILEPGEQVQASNKSLARMARHDSLAPALLRDLPSIAAAERDAEALKDKRRVRSSDITVMSAEMSGKQIQARIASARRDAGALKDRTKLNEQ